MFVCYNFPFKDKILNNFFILTEFGSDSKKSSQFFDIYIITEQARKYTSLLSIILLTI